MRALVTACVLGGALLLTGCASDATSGPRGLANSEAPAMTSRAPAMPSGSAMTSAEPAQSSSSEASASLIPNQKQGAEAAQVAGAGATATACPAWDDFVRQSAEYGHTAIACGSDGSKRYLYLARTDFDGTLTLSDRSGYGPFFTLISLRPCKDGYARTRYYRDLPWMQGYC